MDTSTWTRPVYFPRGVASRDAALGCTTHAGTLYGLHLTTGRLRWQTSAARRPLLILANRLFASDLAAGQANILRLQSLALDNPERDQRSPSNLVFPPWVDVTDGDTFTFDVYGAPEEVVLHWRARRRYRGGAPPPTALLQALPQALAGVARINAVTGAVVMTNAEPQADAAPPAPHLTTTPFEMGSSRRAEPWRFQEAYRALTTTVHTGKHWLVLRRQTPDGNVADVELCAVEPDTTPRVTRDGGFVLAWTAPPSVGQRHGGTECAVFRADTGAPVATVALDPEAEDPCVLEPHLYGISANTLTAVDLDRGEPAWSWPFPVAKFKGPPPLRQ